MYSLILNTICWFKHLITILFDIKIIYTSII